ncbi:IS4/IS5 family transposase [Lachnospiraceae bacterium ZAX-1]
MTYPEQVKSFLWSAIFEMSQYPGKFAKNPEVDFSRKRKLDFENLLRFLISMGCGSTGHELLKYFNYDLDVLSNATFYQQRKKLLSVALQHLLFQFNSYFSVEKYKGRYQLVACDGSEFNIARNPDDPDTFHPPSGKSTKGFNMIYTISFYDILNKRYLDCVIQPSRQKNGFQAICEPTDRYQYGGTPIFISDRGFSSFNYFAHAMNKGVFFLVRAKDINTKHLLKLETLPAFIDKEIELILTRTQSQKARKHPELAQQYRHICSEVSL